ncbi:hypothetical protein SAMN04487995_3557 [Dyadobacter koreensis]|uniref:Uncharacterized protein n=1 Tax=Dyadobacter koreensis TaxID=408657 RepID=A0A1H6WL06_9BACT|nr:hypothetical protein [Dyadobacter koreensis]SEJ16416.1 hypothetical protein SAMN04487995_3557 [Dyadobacter koreensis]
MYFFDLPGFHPVSGIDTEDQGQYPYLHFKNSMFEREEINYYNSNFPFKKLVFSNGETLFVSEKNLIAVFQYNPVFKDDLLIDHSHPISAEQLNIIKHNFSAGYSAGCSDFPREIHSMINLVDGVIKEKKLGDFIEFCGYHLFFEGFATPKCLYALGFIQAYLLKAFGEYRNLIQSLENSIPVVKVEEWTSEDEIEESIFLEVTQEDEFTEEEPDEEVANEPDVTHDLPLFSPTDEVEKATFDKIPLDYPVEEIISLWMILLEVWKCRPVNSIQVFFEPEEVLELLGCMFDDSKKKGMLPQSEFKFYSLPPGKYERILNMLMHVTYKLNTDRNNINLERYCEALIGTFSCYSKTKVTSLKSNINKERGNIIQSIKSLPNSDLLNDFFKTLGKVNEYKI